MKIITLHSDYIKFKPLKKALKSIDLTKEPISEKLVREPLVILTAIEKGDTIKLIEKLVNEIKSIAKQVNAKTIVLYPYSHLSPNLTNPEEAMKILNEAEKSLKKIFKKVVKAPFGYYKEFEIKVKGHPLAELSREIKDENEIKEIKNKSEKKELEEKYDIKQLLKETSRAKLDTSKLKENDHRILGQKMDLFSFHDSSPGSVFWHSNGLIIFNELLNLSREVHKNHNYKEVSTPQILDSKIWKISGHWLHYKDNMFLTNYENKEAGVKAMNCPGMMLIYKSQTHSYKELPIRMLEYGIVHRKELSGVLSGLFRLVRFTQDDAHIFIKKEQIEDEINDIFKIIEEIYKKTFNFDYHLELSTKPKEFLGEKKIWDEAEKSLESALKKSKIKYNLNKGEGAFYGPKIDLHIKDSLGRNWQCATIQLDMQMPKRFELKYIDKNSKEQNPLIIHRAIFGSIERFIGILLEHTNGNLPLWLSPIQIRVINFTDRNNHYVEKIVKEIKQKIPDIRIDIDLDSVPLSGKVRNAELMKIPYIIVLGDKEEKENKIAIRKRGSKNIEVKSVEEFINFVKQEIEERK
ncbi:MAG: threonine--tRNA ligase [Candidatus Pacearchaeota archaeon]